MLKVASHPVHRVDLKDTDEKVLRSKNLTSAIIEEQFDTLKRGGDYVNILQAADRKNGIQKYTARERKRYLKIFRKEAKSRSFTQFVVASGKGTRMVQDLWNMHLYFNPENETFSSYVNRTQSYDLLDFFRNLKKFPFYKVLRKINKQQKIKKLTKDEQKVIIAKTVLFHPDLNFHHLPVALFPFFKRLGKKPTTALYEQVIAYIKTVSSFKDASLVVSADYQFKNRFQVELDQILNAQKHLRAHPDSVRIVTQSENSQTVCLNDQIQLVRDQDEHLLFWPAGHGTLVSELNEIDSDLLYITAIQNVRKSNQRANFDKFRKMMIGKLVSDQKKIFSILSKIEASDFSCEFEETNSIFRWLKENVQIEVSSEFHKKPRDKQNEELFQLLNRPLRICAVVKSKQPLEESPFWIQKEEGSSIEFVHSAAINFSSQTQKDIFETATYTNPIEIIGAIKDFRGAKFLLNEYCSDKDGATSDKSFEGQSITILERPGLWNGSMHGWNSIYVEMPEKFYRKLQKMTDLLAK